MAGIIIELSNNLTNWVSQIDGVDIYSYCEQGSFSVRKGYTFGDKHLTNTLSFNFESTQDMSTTIQLYRYCRMRIDDVVEFVGIADDTSATVTIAEVDRFVTSMRYKDVSSAFSDATFSTPSVNEYDDDQIAIEISADDNVQVCNSNNPAKSLVHILFSTLATEISLPITIDAADISILDIVQYFSANIGDKVLDVITDVLTEAGLTYWCDTLAVHLVDLLAVKTAGTTILDIERNAKINKKTWIETEPPSIKYPSVMVRENQQLYTLGQRKDEFAGLYWNDGDTTAQLSAPDSQDEGGHRITPVAFYDLRANVSSSAKEIRIVNFTRQSFNTVTYNIENPHRWAGLRVVHTLYNAYINGTVKYLVYDSEELPSNGSSVSKSCKYIYSKAMAQRYARAYTVGRKMQQAVWSFYAMEKIPVDSVVRIEGVDVSALRITAVANDCGAFGGYTYTASPYSLDVPITFNSENRAAVLADVGTNRNLSLELTGTQFVYFADGTPVSTDPIRVWINAENLDGVPMLYVAGVRVDLYQDYAPENEPEGDHVYTGRYYYDITPYATAVEDNTITLSVQMGEKTATANVYKVVNGSVAISIQSVTNEYAVNDSATTAPTTGWSATMPSRAEGQTLWVRDVYTYTDGNVARIGARPVTGDNGRGVKSVANYYAKSSSSTVAPSSWEPEPVTTTTTEPYLWTYSVTTYTDDSTASTTPAVIGSLGKNGKDGNPGTPAIVFEIYADKAAYTISKRQVETQTVQLAVDRQNVEGTITWDIPQGVEWNQNTLTITIPAKTTTASYTIGATLDGITRSVTITGVAQEDTPEYLGALSIAPSTVARIDGDHYLNTTDYIPYVYDETANSGAGGWIELTTSSQYYYTVINDTVADFGKLGVQAPEGSVFENYYDSIAAQSAFIKTLGAQNITLLTGGTIHSDGHTWPAEFPNNPEQAKGFSASADGKIRAEGMETVNMKAVNAEISGSFKAQAMETVDEVPKISNLKDFNIVRDNQNPYLFELPSSLLPPITLSSGNLYTPKPVITITNDLYKIMTLTDCGIIVASKDGYNFETLRTEANGIDDTDLALVWSNDATTYYAMIPYTAKKPDGSIFTAKRLITACAKEITGDWNENETIVFSNDAKTILLTDENKALLESAGRFVIIDNNNGYLRITVELAWSRVYTYTSPITIDKRIQCATYHDGKLYVLCDFNKLHEATGSIVNGEIAAEAKWQTYTFPDTSIWYNTIIYGGGYFVASGRRGTISYWTDLNDIKTFRTGYLSSDFYRLWYVNNTFIAGQVSSSLMYYATPDNITSWDSAIAMLNPMDVKWDGTCYYISGSDGVVMLHSDFDGGYLIRYKDVRCLGITDSNEIVGLCCSQSGDTKYYSINAGCDAKPIIDYYSNLIGNGVKADNGEDLTEEPLKYTHDVTGTLDGQSLIAMKASSSEVVFTFSDGTTRSMRSGAQQSTDVTLNNVTIEKTDASVKLLNPKITGRGSVPIGFIYTQYPNQQSPELIFDGEWEDITSQYAGAFFRAEGGDSLAFGTMQAEGLPNIKGNINVATWSGPCGGAFLDGGKESDNAARSGSGSGLGGFRRNFDASAGETTTDGTIRTTPLVYGKSDHVTPVNFSIRIWKRIS